MPQQVCTGAVLMCTFGSKQSELNVSPRPRPVNSGTPAANIMDHIPMQNILPFGQCIALATPQPCVPKTAQPWAPGSRTVKINGYPAVQSSCQLLCQLGGLISVQQAGQTKVNTK